MTKFITIAAAAGLLAASAMTAMAQQPTDKGAAASEKSAGDMNMKAGKTKSGAAMKQNGKVDTKAAAQPTDKGAAVSEEGKKSESTTGMDTQKSMKKDMKKKDMK